MSKLMINEAQMHNISLNTEKMSQSFRINHRDLAQTLTHENREIQKYENPTPNTPPAKED